MTSSKKATRTYLLNGASSATRPRNTESSPSLFVIVQTFGATCLYPISWQNVLPKAPKMFLSHSSGGHPFKKERKLLLENSLEPTAGTFGKKEIKYKEFTYNRFLHTLVNMVVIVRLGINLSFTTIVYSFTSLLYIYIYILKKKKTFH